MESVSSRRTHVGDTCTQVTFRYQLISSEPYLEICYIDSFGYFWIDSFNVTLRAFNVDFLNFSILGFRSCVPLVADRSNTLNSVWQEPSRLRLTGVSDLTAVATLQEFLHGISMGSVLFCLFAVFNLSLLYQYLWISCHKVPKTWNSFTNSGKGNLLTPTIFQSFVLVQSN